jgi:hypothetical protein
MRSTAGCLHSAAANTEAVEQARRTRSGSVSSPRRSRNASSGARQAPVSTRTLRMLLISSMRPVTTPPVASACPPMYLVAECSTRSASCSSGRQITGGASVESMTSSDPFSCAMSASLRRSATAVVGLAIVSAYTTLVAGRMAALTWSRSVMSTNSVSTPNREATLRRKPYVRPWTAEDATTCAPARAKVQNTPLTAAMPEANACAAGQRGRFTPSSAATARANASTVGLSIRL